MFVPWSIPAALGVAAGVGVHAAGWPGTAAVAIALLALPLACGGRSRIWALLPLLVPLGWARHAQREARPEPLAPLAGSTVELAGRSDGRLLHLAAPGGVVVALRPVGEVPRGRVRVRGVLRTARGARNPGAFDEHAWLRRRDGAHVLQVERSWPAALAPADRAPAPGAAVPAGASEPFRDRVRAAITRGLSPPQARLMRALVLGEREDAGDLRDTFARAGLAHLLALSGLHLGVLAGAVAVLLAPLGPARWAVVAILAPTFALWIGPTPSLVRAAAMTAAVGVSAAVGAGRPHAFASLSLAAAGTLVARPDWLHDVSFGLSYGSLIGILGLGVPLTRGWTAGRPGWHPRVWIGGGLAVSASAVLATLPWTVSTFGSVPPFGPIVNLPALPLAGVLVPLGLAAGLAGAAWPPLGAPFAAATAPLASLLLGLAEAGARLPSLPWAEIGPFGKTLWVLALAPWAAVVRGRLKPWRALCVVACAAAVAAVSPFRPPVPEVVVLDVGQGDSILVRLPDRTEILVDGGGTPFSDYDVAAGVVVPALRALGVDELELVVATHADADHMEGLATVLREVPVLALAYGYEAPGKRVWDELAAVAAGREVPLLPLRRGHRLDFGEASLHVLHPTGTADGVANEDSVALRIDWRGRPWALLLGDVGERTEAGLAVPPVPLLLAPHHGSGHSTSPALLAAARPEVVAISVGANGYGHPARSVLARIAASGAEVRRTDLDGALRFRPGW